MSKEEENKLLRRLMILILRRFERPSFEESEECGKLWKDLYELTGNPDYKPFPDKPEKRER